MSVTGVQNSITWIKLRKKVVRVYIAHSALCSLTDDFNLSLSTIAPLPGRDPTGRILPRSDSVSEIDSNLSDSDNRYSQAGSIIQRRRSHAPKPTLGEKLDENGLDRDVWLPILKSTLHVTRAEQLKHLRLEDYIQLTPHSRMNWERRALRSLLNLPVDDPHTQDSNVPLSPESPGTYVSEDPATLKSSRTKKKKSNIWKRQQENGQNEFAYHFYLTTKQHSLWNQQFQKSSNILYQH